jgi:rhodanese-related sulfurtransferase
MKISPTETIPKKKISRKIKDILYEQVTRIGKATSSPKRLERHLPFARSIPFSELKKRIAELPWNKTIVTYCRGPFCLFAGEAMNILVSAGHQARKLDDGVAEWQAYGFAIER